MIHLVDKEKMGWNKRRSAAISPDEQCNSPGLLVKRRQQPFQPQKTPIITKAAPKPPISITSPKNPKNDPLSKNLSLRFFPFEIRAQIFDLALSGDWEEVKIYAAKSYYTSKPMQRNPVLLRALRGEPDLYFEALDVFYGKYTFWCNSSLLFRVRRKDALELGVEAVGRIRRAYLENYNHFTHMPGPWLEHNKLGNNRLLLASSLRELTLHSSPQSPTFHDIKIACHAFPQLQKITVIDMLKEEGLNVSLINEHLSCSCLCCSVTAKLVTVGTIIDATAPVLWLWQAEKGKKLVWRVCALGSHPCGYGGEPGKGYACAVEP